MAELPTAFRVADKQRETGDTWTLRLEPEGSDVERFAPGQFAMLYAFGVGEAPISISSMGGDGAVVHTVRAVAVDGACLRGKCESDPALGYDLMKLISTVFVGRLQDTRLRLLDLYGKDGGG